MVIVLASSIKIEFHLNEALPNTEHARDRLLVKVFRFRRSHQGKSGSIDNDFAPLYAYGETVLLYVSPKPSTNPVS